MQIKKVICPLSLVICFLPGAQTQDAAGNLQMTNDEGQMTNDK
jgi:hypothetical protein